MPPVVVTKKDETPRTVAEFMATDPTTWEYVTIPKEDALGYDHAAIGLNAYSFKPGHTYHLPKQIADFVRDRLAVYAKATIRVLQPKRDLEALNAVPVGAASPASVIELDSMK
jgi:hypothetical protein